MPNTAAGKPEPRRVAAELHGVVPPLITPLLDRDTLDAGALEKLIEHVITGGVHGVFILGSTGEGPSLSYALRRELITRACKQVAGRVPVLVGITDTSFVEATGLAAHAADAGAQMLVTSIPYYFPPGQSELREYTVRLVKELPLPVVLYNIPIFTHVAFAPDTLRSLMEIERIIGIKDSSGDLEYFSGLLSLGRHRPGWSVLVGQDHLLAEALRRGAHGGVCAGAQITPALFVGLYEAAMHGAQGKVADLQKQIEGLRRIYNVDANLSTMIRAVKCAVSLLGLSKDIAAEPFMALGETERARVREIMAEAGLIQAKPTPS